jgi:hypothetical protein
MSALVIDFRTVQSAVKVLHDIGRDDLRSDAVKAIVDETRDGGTGRHILRAVAEHKRLLGQQEGGAA